MTYRPSERLLNLLHTLAPRHVAVSNAPDTLAGIRATKETVHGSPVYTVSSLHSETLWGPASNNHAFRAWHDQLHDALDAGFNAEGEVRVGQAHLALAWNAAVENQDMAFLCAETHGQFAHYTAWGDFPADQCAFAERFIAWILPQTCWPWLLGASPFEVRRCTAAFIAAHGRF